MGVIMKFARKLFTFLVITLMAVILPAQTVMAQYAEISCDNAGVATGGLFDPTIVSAAAGPVDPRNPCGLVTGKIFSSIACHYIIILNEVFSKFFCALQFGMKDMISTVVILFIVLYGARLLIGTQEATGGAAILALIKIAAVFLFATQGTIGVSYIYNFFIALIQQTVAWAFTGINCTTVICLTTDSISTIFSTLDGKIDILLNGTMDTTVTPNVMRNGLFVEKSELVFFIIALILIAFPLFLLAWSLIKMTIMVFVSALVTFMLSITAVAFLISLSPIFMSFMLFNSTYSLFDNWLRFLVSYSLQPMIVFSILALWLITADDFLGFIGQLTKVMTVISDDSKNKVGVLTLEDTVAFCPIYYGDTSSSINYTTVSPFMNITLGGPTIKCCTIVSTDPVVCSAVEPTTPDDPNLLPRNNLVKPEAMLRDTKFLYFLGYHFIALTAIGYAFLHLMKMTPQIAQALSRSQSQMPLGAGFGNGGGLGSMISQATSKGRAVGGKIVGDAAQRGAPVVNEAMGRFAPNVGGPRR